MRIILLVLVILGILVYLYSRRAKERPENKLMIPKDDGNLLIGYEVNLEKCKEFYPFNSWEANLSSGLDQYTQENCERAQKIFDELIESLMATGEGATENGKLQLFKKATEALNDLNESTHLIETGERESLCELFNRIAIAVNIDPAKYGDGEGPASEWRDW